jgi:hypothetical protein
MQITSKTVIATLASLVILLLGVLFACVQVGNYTSHPEYPADEAAVAGEEYPPPAAALPPAPETPPETATPTTEPPRETRPSHPQPSAPKPPFRNFPGAVSPGPPAAPPIAASPGDAIAALDRVLEGLAMANIAFNTPESINFEQTAIIELVLSLGMPIEELKEVVVAEGAKEGASIRVSERMETRLTGPNFAITAITPEVQGISGVEITQWKWEVKPTQAGSQRLHLTLSALFDVDGTRTSRVIRTFDKEIAIKVTWQQKSWTFLKSYWQWLWAAVLVPIIGWLWKKRKGRKNK